ncbi:hypothetical protein ACSQ67_010010 [Phaseolus vulgaris]
MTQAPSTNHSIISTRQRTYLERFDAIPNTAALDLILTERRGLPLALSVSYGSSPSSIPARRGAHSRADIPKAFRFYGCFVLVTAFGHLFLFHGLRLRPTLGLLYGWHCFPCSNMLEDHSSRDRFVALPPNGPPIAPRTNP